MISSVERLILTHTVYSKGKNGLKLVDCHYSCPQKPGHTELVQNNGAQTLMIDIRNSAMNLIIEANYDSSFRIATWKQFLSK
jgi:hypothetical protein